MGPGRAGCRARNLAAGCDRAPGRRSTATAPARRRERSGLRRDRLDEQYSTEVQQLTRTRGDLRGRGWTCCRQMACKRSAVRARLAPPGQPYNSNNLKRDFERLVALPGAATEP